MNLWITMIRVIPLLKVIIRVYNKDIPMSQQEHERLLLNTRGKGLSWPNSNNTLDQLEAMKGPNINIKVPKRTFRTQNEKLYFENKIKTKKKTEVHFNKIAVQELDILRKMLF